MSYENKLRREFKERWAVLNIAFVGAFWISITLLLDNAEIMDQFSRIKLTLFARILFLHFVPFNVLYLLASGFCYSKPVQRWHEHRVFCAMLLIAGILWAMFLPSAIVIH